MYSNFYRRYVAAVLLLVYIFNQLDRGVFNILMEPIRQQFSLTDTQLGFVVGPALVVLYSCLGVPVARWADHSSRVKIMTVAIALWSVITVLTATVNEFWQLALVRIGVGVGEAGFSAIAISVIGDYETDQNRARALATFMLAIPISNLLSDLFGGWVNQLYGWRWVFIIAGLPGILFTVLMRTTVREPARRPAAEPTDPSRPPLRVVLSTLWRRRSLRHLMIAQGLANLVANVIGWVYVFFVRQHHMSTGALGSWFAVADAVMFGGVWLSGFLSAKFGTKDPGMNTQLMGWGAVPVAPLALFMLWCPSKEWALFGYVVLNVPMYLFLGPTQALVQNLVGPSMRATMASIFILVQMLAGGVLGTQVVGLLSDALTPLAGNATEALRWSMALGSMLTLWTAAQFWMATKYVRQDLAAAPVVATTVDSIEVIETQVGSGVPSGG